MAAVAVSTQLPVMRTSESWQYGDPSLIDLRLSLLDRGQSENVTRRKRKDSSRSRHSWRWSWKQMFTKPFQYQTWSRGGSMREKRNGKKRKSENQNASKNSVETRKKMDELYRIWLCDVDESSDESSDEEVSERDRRRSCYPRIFSSDTSSSDSDTEDENQVSEYVREGPSRIKMDIIREGVGINEVSDTSSQTSDTSDSSSSEINLIHTPNQGRVNHVVDLSNPDIIGHENIVRQNENVAEYEVAETKTNNSKQLSPTEPSVSWSVKQYEVAEIKTNVELTILSHPITKTANIRAISSMPEYGNLTNYEEQSQCLSEPVVKHNDAKLSTVSGQMSCNHNEEIVESHYSQMNLNDCSHERLTSSQEATTKSSLEQTESDRIKPGVMTRMPDMINNCHNERVISVRQIYHQDILKRVDELCAQCGEDVYCREQINLGSFEEENGVHHDNMKVFSIPESGLEKHNFDGISNNSNSPQEGWQKESIEKPLKIVAPDYPSSYSKTESHYQMSTSSEEQNTNQQCEFKRFGCLFSGSSTAVDKHNQSSLNDHLKLVSKLAQDQKEQLESQQLEQQKQSLLIQQLTDTVNNLEKLVKEQSQVYHSQEKMVHNLKDQMKDQRKQCQRFEREITNQIEVNNQSPTSSLPTTPCAAEFVWQIKNFKKRLRRIQDGEMDDPLISEPFYTGSYGYKLSMWVYLNGRGKTHGDWVSVYARVMPSDHDNILSWPVRPMYTFTLLDQSEGEKDNIVRKRKVNDIKRDGGKHHGIHRPEGGERSVIVGFDDFVAHSQLEKRKYIVDDCIYLKLEANIVH